MLWPKPAHKQREHPLHITFPPKDGRKAGKAMLNFPKPITRLPLAARWFLGSVGPYHAFSIPDSVSMKCTHTPALGQMQRSCLCFCCSILFCFLASFLPAWASVSPQRPALQGHPEGPTTLRLGPTRSQACRGFSALF